MKDTVWIDPQKMGPYVYKIRALRVLKQVIYILALFILVLILMIQSIKCFQKYLKHPTYMSSTIVDQPDSEFPAVTICPADVGFKMSVLKNHGFVEEADYNDGRDGRTVRWTSNDSSVSPRELYDKASFSLKELVQSLYARYFCKINGEFGKEIDLDDGNVFIEQRHREYGKCYTIYPEEQLKKKGRAVYYFHMKFLQPVIWYLHKHGQFLDLSGRMGYRIYPGERLESQVNYQDARMLMKQKEDSTLMTCSHENYDACMYAAMAKHMYREVQCTVPFIRNNSRICETPFRSNITFWMYYNRVTNQMKDCLDPCSFLIINVGAKNVLQSSENGIGELFLYFAPKVMLSQEHYLYTFLSLMAEIGGYVGLLLGVSLFHGAGFVQEVINNKIRKYEKEGRITPVVTMSSSS